MSGATIIGNVNVDLIVRPATELPPPGEEWPVGGVEMRPGGAAVNTSLALKRLGTTPRLIGCVGEDLFGRYMLDALAQEGLESDVATSAAAPTGVSIAFEAPERERSFLTSMGSLASFDRSMVPDDALGSAYVLVCGYFLMPALRGAPTRALLQEAHLRGGTTLFDAGWDPAGWPAATADEFRALLPLADLFLPNESEAASLSGEGDVRAAARALHERSGGWVVVKRGPQGCLAAGPRGEVLEAAAPRVDVTDTTGAGDAFNAGLIAALLGGAEMSSALRFATRVASTVVSRPSARRYPGPSDLVAEAPPGSIG